MATMTFKADLVPNTDQGNSLGTTDKKWKINGVNTPILTDHNVTQTISTTNADYRILLSATADDTTRTEGARKDADFYYNPSTNLLHVNKISSTNSGGSWHKGRDSAIVKGTVAVNSSTYYPGISMKTFQGDWSIGTLGSGGQTLYFVSVTDNNYTNDNNKTVKYTLSGSLTDTDNLSYPISYGTGGSSSLPIYVNNTGKVTGITATSVAYGGTGSTTQTASRMCYTNSSGNITSGYHYVDSTHVAIGSTTVPDTMFYVNGIATVTSMRIKGSANSTNYISSDAVTNMYFGIQNSSTDTEKTTALVITANTVRSGQSAKGTIDLGTSSIRWKALYSRKLNVYTTSYGTTLPTSDMETGDIFFRYVN